jgi:hypothetical protein
MPVEFFRPAGSIVRTGGGAHSFSANDKINARFSWILPAADEEVDAAALDLEPW